MKIAKAGQFRFWHTSGNYRRERATAVHPRVDGRDQGRRMTAVGHEDQFPPPRPSVRHRFGEPTFAGRHGNGRDAPILAVGTDQPAEQIADVREIKQIARNGHAFVGGFRFRRLGLPP